MNKKHKIKFKKNVNKADNIKFKFKQKKEEEKKIIETKKSCFKKRMKILCAKFQHSFFSFHLAIHTKQKEYRNLRAIISK